MSRRTVATGAAVALTGTAFLVILYLTSESAAIGGDYYDSPFFWWGWVILLAMAAAAAAIAPEGALMWGGLIVLPQAVATVVGGAYLHDPGEGASFWPIGLMFVGYLGLLATAAAWIVRAWRRRRL